LKARALTVLTARALTVLAVLTARAVTVTKAGLLGGRRTRCADRVRPRHLPEG
jgi:hypothetical protein